MTSAVSNFILKLPAISNSLSPAHPVYELLAAITSGDEAVGQAFVSDVSCKISSFSEPLDSYGSTLLHIAALSNRPNIMHVLFSAADAAVARALEDRKMSARKDAVVAAHSHLSMDSAALENLERLEAIASEQQFLELLSVKDSSRRSVLHYAAAAHGVMVDDGLLLYRADRFSQTVTGPDGRAMPLFPRGAYVNIKTGELLASPPASSSFSPSASAAAASSRGGGGLLGGASGDYVSVSSLHRTRTDPAIIDAQDAYGATPLIYATIANDVRGVHCLLSHGADAYHTTLEGVTALDLAANKTLRMALLPLPDAVNNACGSPAARPGARPPTPGIAAALSPSRTATGTQGNTLRSTLQSSGARGDLTASAASATAAKSATSSGGGGLGSSLLDAEAALEMLMSSGANVNALSGIKMRAPLHRASELGAIDVAEVLLSNGAVVDVRDAAGCTPLHLAAELGSPRHVEMVRLLIDAGACVNATSTLRKTPLHLAATGGPQWRVETSPIAFARSSIPVDETGERIEGGGAVAVEGAAASEETAAAAAAASAAASSSSSNSSSSSSSSAAAAAAPSPARKTSSTEREGNDEEGLPSLTASDGGSAMISMLVLLGANIEAVDHELNTPLHAAARRGCFPSVDTLLTLGARPYSANLRGHTPLHLAAQQGHGTVVQQLVRWDAEVGKLKWILDTSGRSAFDMGSDSATREALHTLWEVAAGGQLDLVQSTARLGSGIPLGISAPWLSVRPYEVTRVLRRSCIHAAITGAARAMAKGRAAGTLIICGGDSLAPVPSSGKSSAASSRPSSASAVRTVAGLGLRFIPSEAPIALGPRHAMPPLSKMAWSGSPADVNLTFYEPPNPALLHADPYAYTAPGDAAMSSSSSSSSSSAVFTSNKRPSAASHAVSEASTLAQRRVKPGSELTSATLEKEYGRIVEWLVRMGCDVNGKDIDGVTPTMLAARYGLLFILRRLLNHKANCAALDRAGNTAFHYAYAFDHTVAASILDEFAEEAVMDVKNKEGKTPLQVAGAGLAIIPDTTEKLLTVHPKPAKSSTLVVT